MRLVSDAGVLARRVTIGIGLVLVGGSALIALTNGGPLPGSGTCTVTTGSTATRLTSEQAANAATIVALSVRRGLPLRAATIAVATAIQESKLINVEHGDRDSLGLFQQRPSQGWGTAEEILDPVYSANAFYDALLRVRGWQTMSVTEAAQAVQRSAFPEAYAVHEESAAAIASALSGRSLESLTCTIQGGSPGLDASATAASVRNDVNAAFGRAVRVSQRGGSLVIRPTDDASPRITARAVASYLVARAGSLPIGRVEVGELVWERSSGAWRPSDPQDANTVAVALT